MSTESDTELWLVRHGATEWSTAGRHTSVTDLPLLPDGEQTAVAFGARLSGKDFRLVLTSPRRRARHTAELAGFADAEVTDDLAEWAYGDYEGLTTPQIRESVPGWTVWTHPSPGGETGAQVAARLDRVVARARDAGGGPSPSRTGTRCGCWRRAGSACRRRTVGCCGSTPPPCRSSASSGRRPSCCAGTPESGGVGLTSAPRHSTV